MRRRKMIGAHVAPRPTPKSKNPGRSLAREFNAAYDKHFVTKPHRTHLAFQPAVTGLRIT